MEIDRRAALLGLAAAGATVPLLVLPAQAQTQPASSVAGADNYVQQTLLVGSVALKTSEIAVQKATDPNVKQFAELEVAEQQTVASVLSATPAGQQPPEMPPERQQMIDDLNAMEAGPEFDQAYLQGQIEGHNELLQIQQTLSGEREASVEAVTARLAEQAVASHLAMLNLIQQMLGAENIQNIQQGANPDGSTTPGQTEGQGGGDAAGQGEGGAAGGEGGAAGGEGGAGGGTEQAPAEGTPPASNGG